MKNCPKCHKEVAQDYDVCWNCSYNFITTEMEGLVSDKVEHSIEPKKLDCLRCKTTMKFESTIRLHEGNRFGIIGALGDFFNSRESFDVYVCPNCEKVEFFAPTVSKY